MLAPFARAPEAVIPVGQTAYVSRVTNQEEWFPATIGVVGARGCDVKLLGFLRDVLETGGMRTGMRVRRTAFPIQGSGDMEEVVAESVLWLRQAR